MSTLLLKTKLYIPSPRPGLVPRPRLVERLEEGLRLGCKLALISAPAGSGKTTLLSEWVAHAGRPVAWVSLDQDDNDPLRFWSYVIAALQGVYAEIGQSALALLRSSDPPVIEVMLTALINELALAPKACILVLDDYHLIETSLVHNSMAFLLEHLPPTLYPVIATRSDPPLPLSRLRGRNQLAELRTADLRFTLGEADAFLNQAMNLELAAQDISALETSTEGWVVGLQMAALSLKGRDTQHVSGLVATLTDSHRYVLDYLTDEVLSQQSQDVRAFLLQTSILDRMTGPLCDAVTGQSDGQEMLKQLETDNLFIVPLDDERRWYRYHQLFADLLRKRLKEMQPELWPLWYLRASQWYEHTGLLAEAVSLALVADDIKRVARLVGGNALAMMEHGELRTLEKWLRALSDETVRSQPWLCIAHAWMLAFTDQIDAVEPLLEHAEKAARDESESLDGQRIRGHIAAVRACVALLRGDKLQTEQLARQALELLPADDLMTRGWAVMVLGLIFYQKGDMAAAEQSLSEAVKVSRASGDRHVAVLALCNLATMQMGKGQLRKAAGTFQAALQLADDYAARAGRRLPVSAYAHAYLGGLLWEWNEREAALNHLRQAIEISEQWGEPLRLTGAYIGLAAALRSAGDFDGALNAIHKARQAQGTLSPWNAARVAAVEAHILLDQGNLAAASRWVAARGDNLDDCFDVFDYWNEDLVAARIMMAQGCLDEALNLLRQVLAGAQAVGGICYVIESLALQSVVLQAQDRHDQALAALERALALAGPEGYVRTFVDEGAPMGDLLRQALSQGAEVGYAAKLLAALESEKRMQATVQPSVSLLVEPLSERELDVLRLLAAGMSNREIAQELYLSINTVKTHTKSIYGKLDVRSRTQAVNRAVELGIL